MTPKYYKYCTHYSYFKDTNILIPTTSVHIIEINFSMWILHNFHIMRTLLSELLNRVARYAFLAAQISPM